MASSKAVVAMMAIFLVVASCFPSTPVESRPHAGGTKDLGCQEMWTPCFPGLPCCTGVCPIAGMCIPLNALEDIVANAKAKEVSKV